MPRPTIEQIRSLGDFQTIFRWNISMLEEPTALPNLISKDKFNFLCETATVPKATLNTYEVNIRGHKIHNNGIMTYDNTITLTMAETVSADIRKFIRRWREAYWQTRTGRASGDTNSLKAKFSLELLDNTDTVDWRIILVGCLLQDHDLGQLDGVSSDSMRPTLTFMYDYYDDGQA